MNERFFLGFEDNFEIDSRMIETGMAPEMRIVDLSDAEKAEIFEIEFTMEDELEMTR
jgi:hypothetical protein